MSDSDIPLISCLTVTENRPAFMPWLLWCFDRQTYARRELVIVDSSSQPLDLPDRADVRILRAPPGTGVAAKRNMSLEAAGGEIVTWFDDDDWQHPLKLAWLEEALRKGAPYAGSVRGWFVNLRTRRCALYRSPSLQIIFNSAGFRRDAICDIRFPERLRKASDTSWLQKLFTQFHDQAVLLDRVLFFWLCHDRNLSNPAARRQFAKSLSAMRNEIDADAWGDTDDALRDLVTRLDHPHPAAVPRVSVPDRPAQPEPAASQPDREYPPVGVMIKATVMDTAYLDTMVRHMIGQARYQFAERAIIIERQAAFSGKYRSRTRSTEAQLDQVVERLVADQVVDAVREVDYAPSRVRSVMSRFFEKDVDRVPTHAVTGGPIYATLFGLESMSTRFVLQMDCDVLFYTSGKSWVRQALDTMTRDPRLWLMMTHPGPPAGPVGQSLGPRNARLARWDAGLCLWRFQTATTRYFVCDRDRLVGRIQPIFQNGGCLPLEQCIGDALQRHGAFRGNLGDLKSWHLHAAHHASPFPEWAQALADAVARGDYPASQRGQYDIRLDAPAGRRAWETILRRRTVEPAPQVVTPDAAHGSPSVQDTAPLAVVIPIRDRAGDRVRNALRSLRWQSGGPPRQVLIVSHGSRGDIDRELAEICRQEEARLITVGGPDQPWNKSLALNVGIRAVDSGIPIIMSMDCDIVLAPDFLAAVQDRLRKSPPALVLCQAYDLPSSVSSGAVSDARRFDRLKTLAKLRPRTGSGAIQAAHRDFFFSIRGYDEDLEWWGAMDGDILNRARLMGLEVAWIDDRTSVLHQWHPRKWHLLTDSAEIRQARRSWARNHELVRDRAAVAQRNAEGWGGMAD